MRPQGGSSVSIWRAPRPACAGCRRAHHAPLDHGRPAPGSAIQARPLAAPRLRRAWRQLLETEQQIVRPQPCRSQPGHRRRAPRRSTCPSGPRAAPRSRSRRAWLEVLDHDRQQRMDGGPPSSTPVSPASIGPVRLWQCSRRSRSSATGTGGSPASRSRSGTSPATSGPRGRRPEPRPSHAPVPPARGKPRRAPPPRRPGRRRRRPAACHRGRSCPRTSAPGQRASPG
jgi:hypothetical protein